MFGYYWYAMLEDLSTWQINAELPLTPDQHRALQSYLRPDLYHLRQLKREVEIVMMELRRGFGPIWLPLWGLMSWDI